MPEPIPQLSETCNCTPSPQVSLRDCSSTTYTTEQVKYYFSSVNESSTCRITGCNHLHIGGDQTCKNLLSSCC